MGLYNARVPLDADGSHVLHARRVVSISASLGSPLIVQTSADLTQPVRLAPEDFTDTERRAHSDRAAARGGAAKGRLIYCMHGSRVLAFLGIHVPKKAPLMCQAVAVSGFADTGQASLMLSHLIACAQELSEALGRPKGVIAWATNDEGWGGGTAHHGLRPRSQAA